MKQNKLKAYWNKKEKDIYFRYPLGIGTKCDAHFLSGVFNENFLNELRDRGYDISTLKFEILVDKNSNKYAEMFPSLAQED
jgi:hypothetical protein